ncbi:hypothetical protein C2S51_034848 [Perilla frutescens var. frutescens]|nr:hypothetical protein C2S51_034848 [Perilla frutescens var. frutescens]
MPGSSNKCFSAILNRLLCSGGLPTHPSEQLNESSSVKLEIVPKCSESSAKPPGVVARLMGLESFPAPQKERTLGDFFRSRSVNSIDFLSHLDPLKQYGTPRHRRVRTSLSFREGRISDEFTNVVLLFEEELQKEEEKRREINHGKKVHEIQERRKSVYRKKVGIEVKRKPDFEKKELQGKIGGNLKERRPVMKCEGELMGLKKKNKKNSKILAHKLNCDFKKIHPQGTAPEVVRRATRTTNRSSQTANSQTESSCSNSAVFSENVAVRGKNGRKSTKIDENFCNKKMVEEICLVSEEDIVRENYWINGMELKFDDFEEICQLFGQEILQVLLKQFVDDLVLNFSQ